MRRIVSILIVFGLCIATGCRHTDELAAPITTPQAGLPWQDDAYAARQFAKALECTLAGHPDAGLQRQIEAWSSYQQHLYGTAFEAQAIDLDQLRLSRLRSALTEVTTFLELLNPDDAAELGRRAQALVASRPTTSTALAVQLKTVSDLTNEFGVRLWLQPPRHIRQRLISPAFRAYLIAATVPRAKIEPDETYVPVELTGSALDRLRQILDFHDAGPATDRQLAEQLRVIRAFAGQSIQWPNPIRPKAEPITFDQYPESQRAEYAEAYADAVENIHQLAVRLGNLLGQCMLVERNSDMHDHTRKKNTTPTYGELMVNIVQQTTTTRPNSLEQAQAQILRLEGLLASLDGHLDILKRSITTACGPRAGHTYVPTRMLYGYRTDETRQLLDRYLQHCAAATTR